MRYRGINPESGTATEVLIEQGRIASIGQIEAKGLDLPYISRGFLDMQVNGYKGSDYSLDDLDRRHIESIIRSLAASGTTQHVPTIVTSPRDRIVRNLKTITEARRESSLIAAAIVGIHIEGPYISGEDGPRGAHDPNYVRDPDFGEFIEWQDAADGLIRIVTLAPERKGAMDFIEKVVKAGVIAAIGHTAASPETIREAVSAGCTLSTHLGNGSHASVPRLKNYIWEQMAADGLKAGIISDGFHLPAAVVKVLVRAKGMDRLILVSDVAYLGGCPAGLYKWGNLDVEVFADGHIGLPGTTFLAGAAHLLDWDIPAFMRFAGATLGEAIRLCTVNPAILLSRDTPATAPSAASSVAPAFAAAADATPGRLAVGSPADIVLFRQGKDEKRLTILKTLIHGKEIP